jgi:plasmid stabilization system protein ParE
LYGYIAARSGAARAIGYVGRIERYCQGFARPAERGTKRDDLRPGLRIAGFERRVTIAFHVDPGTVTIDRILMAVAISIERSAESSLALRNEAYRRGARPHARLPA